MSTDGKNRPNIRRTGRIGGPNPGAAQLDYWHRQEHEAILKQALAAIPQFQGVRSIQVGSTQLTGNVKLATSDTVNVVHADDAVRFQAFATTQTENITGGGGNPAQSIVPVTYVVAAANSKNPLRADYRCSGTGDQTTIQNAINALPSEGGSVALLEGTYHLSGTVTLPSNVTLLALGTGAILKREFNSTAFYYQSGGTGLLTIGDFGTTAITNVEVRGITFDGNVSTYPANDPFSPTTGNYGILLKQRCSNIRIRECTFQHMGDEGIVGFADGSGHEITNGDFTDNVWLDEETGYGFALWGNSGTVQLGNRFQRNRAPFVRFQRCERTDIRENVLNFGVRLETCTASAITDNTLYTANDGTVDVRHLIDLEYSTDTEIVGNRIYGMAVISAWTLGTLDPLPAAPTVETYGIYALNLRGGRLLIADNQIVGVGTGVYLNDVTFVHVQDNLLMEIANYGIYCQPSTVGSGNFLALTDNRIHYYGYDSANQGASDGIFCAGGNQYRISDNVFYNPSDSAATGVSINLYSGNPPSNVVLSGNEWYGPGTGITDNGTSTVWIMQHDGTNLRTTNEGIQFKGYGESSGYVWACDSSGVGSWQNVAAGPGAGTVTSVSLTVPSWLTVSGSPVTTSGTLAVTATTGQTANQVLATPAGTTGAVSLRSLVVGDLPTVDVAHGGTGATSFTAATLIGSNASTTTGAMRAITVGSGLSLSGSTLSATGAGSVTSVGLSLPSEFSVSGSPVTSSGTLSASWASETTNTVLAAPRGSTGTPSFRTLKQQDFTTRWEPLTNGLDASPDLIYASGDCIVVEVTN